MDSKIRAEMEHKFKTVRWTGGHPCGYGSLFHNTVIIRNLLAKVVKEYNIHSISDAGAGDLSWIEHVKWPHQIEYTAYDIYPRHKDVVHFDITSQILPTKDLILCRYVLNHLVPKMRQAAIEKFNKSNSGYILTTIGNPDKIQFYNNYWGEPLFPLVYENIKTKRKWYYGMWRLNNAS